MDCPTCNNNLPLAFNVQTFLNSTCTNCGDSGCLPAKNSCYTGPALPCTGIVTGDDLEVALTKVDTLLCSATGDYSLYNKHCLPSWLGASIDDEGTFVSAITDYACSTQVELHTFINSTFTTYQSLVATQINAINHPGLVCSISNITDVDSLTSILTKYCVSISNLSSRSDLTDVDFSTCFTVVTPPVTIKDGFRTLIDQICQVKALAISGSTVLPTFNNVGSCLAGPLTSTDTLVSTVNKIRDYACSLPTWNYSHLTWGCVGAPTSPFSLELGVQQILTKLNSILPKIPTFGSGFTTSPNADPCLGVTVTAATGSDRFVATNSIDVIPGTLSDKLLGDGIEIDASTTPGKIILVNDHKILADTLDDAPDFLSNKISGSTASGITITPTYNSVTKKIDLVLSVSSSDLCSLLSGCVGVAPCVTYKITPSGTSTLTYTNCDNAVVGPLTISGVTTICAKLNTPYAPNATIANIGACSNTDTSIFNAINNSTSLSISDITSSGARFYTINTGSYSLDPSEVITGTGNTSGIIDIQVLSGSGSASLYRNDAIVQTIIISGSGTSSFSAATFLPSDDLKIIFNSNVYTASIYNGTSNGVISGYTGITGLTTHSIVAGASYAGAQSGFTSSILVTIGTAATADSNMRLYRNGVLLESKFVVGGSAASQTFASQTFTSTDILLITWI